jgi:hypothetical protein
VGNYQFTVGPDIQDLFGQSMVAPYNGAFAIAKPILSGTITDTNGAAVAGVLLSASDGNSAVSDAAGDYHLAVTPGFAGTVTPSKSGWVFVPSARTHSSVTADLGGQNFLAVFGSLTTTATLARNGGNLVMSWPTYAGVRYQLQTATNLPPASWTAIGAPLTGSGGVMTTNIVIGSEPVKFYRLQVLGD